MFLSDVVRDSTAGEVCSAEIEEVSLLAERRPLVGVGIEWLIKATEVDDTALRSIEFLDHFLGMSFGWVLSELLMKPFLEIMAP